MEFEVGGHRRIVDVRRVDGGWVVAIDGQPFFVNAVQAGGRWSLLISESGPGEPGSHEASSVRTDAALRSYDVMLDRRSSTELSVRVNGKTVAVGLVGRGPRARRAQDAGRSGSQAITAPMPGRVVKVLVRSGDAVQAGQPVVVVEAMKMENELRSPCAGTVTDVRAVEGQLVEAKTVLLVVESAEVLPQGS